MPIPSNYNRLQEAVTFISRRTFIVQGSLIHSLCRPKWMLETSAKDDPFVTNGDGVKPRNLGATSCSERVVKDVQTFIFPVFLPDASLGCSPNPCLNAECVLGPDGQAFCECSGGQNGEFCNASSIGVNCEPSSDGDRYIYDQYGGYIQSPGYPEPYGIQQRCPYIIGFPGAERIEIRFENVDIDFSGANYLGYQPGGTIDFASEYVRLESLPSETIVVNDSKVSVFFQTTYANPSQKKGFRMHFRIYVDECRSSPCQNGVCFDEVDGFGCECSPGYEGTLCETNTDDCAIDPCQNGGVCVDDVNGFSCQCSLGYAGDQCETNINECGSNPCLNGAECVDGVNEFSCTCTAGFRGVLCKTENDDEEGEEQEEEEDEGSSDEDDDDD
ncbi:fibropellin-3-like [Patiria miniata]|uniref:Uncharacterized protein n=1 Tax=Patiria miniata TaxID=46514 RepID=A0A914AN23_PATMI|nr:fibropellin-3-like [Patiria miniata]